MNELNIALLQIAPTGTIGGNLLKGKEAVNKAKELGADIAVFPEMWSNGYNIYNREFKEWKNDSIDIESDFIKSFINLSKELNIAILITYLEKRNDDRLNSAMLIDRFGNVKYNYSKVHTCDFDVEKNLTSGDDFYVCSLNTEKGDVEVGCMICYDREFPESARVLMLKGAEVILVPNACPMEINRLSQLRGRAYENMTAICTCNYPVDVPDCNGHSSIFDGMVYLPDVSGSRDTCVLETGENEGVYTGKIDLDKLRWYRENEVHGNCYRKVEKYKILLDKKVNKPFIR